MASIHPFVFLADYRIVVCSRCRHACVGDEIERHLSSDRHKDTAVRDRRPIAEAVRALRGIIRTQNELDHFTFPEPTCGPIPALGPPWTDGVACESCRYLVRSVKKMKEHCRKEHQWINSRTRGGQRKHAEIAPDPWKEGVQCQRFFPGRKASRYFEVGRARGGLGGQGGQQPRAQEVLQVTEPADSVSGGPGEGGASAEPSTPTRTGRLAVRPSPVYLSPGQRGVSRLLASAVTLEKNERHVVASIEDKLEPNPWVRRTGWAEHLESFLTDDHMERLRKTVEGPQEDEKALHFIWDSFFTMATMAQTRVLKIDKGAAVLFEMHREGKEKPERPFEAKMEELSWRRYCTFFAQLVMYLFRTWKLPKEQRPLYKLTWEQGVLAKKLWQAAEVAAEAVEDGDEVDYETLRKLNMKLTEALVDHVYHETPYENVLVSGLAVMGIREDNGWVSVEDYTMRYSALIKIARIVVVARSIASLEKEIAKRIQGGQKEEEALRWTESLYSHVREKTNRFMIKSVAGVMDWLLTTRTYGLKIIYTTPGDGHIQWDGDRISYHRIQFSISQLRDAIYAMIQTARSVLGDALLLEKDEAGEHVGFPAIPWDALEDDWSDTRIGHSFLSDDRNPWPDNGARWLAERISRYPEKKKQWFQEPKAPEGNPVREKAAKQFDGLVEQLRGRLLVLCHLTGGQPGRSTEILGIRHVNTRHGGTRNIMIVNKMVCFITGYHKRYRESDKLKMVFRFLPREVGELVVWYLWLVLPFWQQLRSVMQDADHKSPFLFSESPVYGVMTARDRQDLAEGADPFYDTPGSSQERQQEIGVRDGAGEPGLRYRIGEHATWSPDRMRRALGEYSTMHLGTRFTISSWRHLAIAINRKYCYGHFEPEHDGDEEEEVENRIEDEQAGHSTHVGQVIYAREMQEIFSTSTKRTKFLMASQTWHRFLGLGHVQGMLLGRKRLEPFEELSVQGRLKRQRRLAEVDLHGRLRQMLNSTDASFRPGQERVLQAIHRGYSPILQIVGTGGGKSLSFMLPAYCGGDGITIVVVPLVALRDDMVRRCEEANIQSYIWTASNPRTGAASVVFVTPESIVTKGFSSYVTGLRATSRLDRVVVDECHMIMDSAERESRFRPAFLEIGRLVEEYGVQLIFLTATLAPKDEPFFFQLARIPRDRVQIFRSRTTRANIQYRVREVEIAGEDGDANDDQHRGRAGRAPKKSPEDQIEDSLAQEVEAELERARVRFPAGKIIIYCGTVQRTKALGARLGCPAYFNKAGTAKEKRATLEQWIARGREITATNALGVGLDVPDIREVIHVTAPRRIRDFAQESGRAGRDGQASASVIIRQKAGPIRGHMIPEPVRLPVPAAESTRQVKQRRRLERAMLGQKEAAARQRQRTQTGESFLEEDMAEFLEGTAWRRIVLDKVMDGTEDREDCLEDEQACDLCQKRTRGLGATAGEGDGQEGDGIVVVDSDEGEQEDGELLTARDNLARQEAAGNRAEEARREEARLEERQWAKFRDWLPHWKGCCFICVITPQAEGEEEEEEPEVHHEKEDCPLRDEWVWEGVHGLQQEIEKLLFTDKKLQLFSGCSHCGIPQELCESWKPVWEDGGRFERRAITWQCQMLGEPVRIMVQVLKIRQTKVKAMAKTLMASQGFRKKEVETEGDALFAWMGLRSKWAGHETNNLCRLLYLAVEEWLQEREDEAGEE